MDIKEVSIIDNRIGGNIERDKAYSFFLDEDFCYVLLSRVPAQDGFDFIEISVNLRYNR